MIRLPLFISLVLVVSSASLPRPLGIPADHASLAGHRFRSVSVARAGSEVPLVRSGSWYGPGVWIDFFFSTLTASGGCNMASGASWSIEGGVLKVDHDYGNTLIGCGPSADAQDHWWINLLNASPAAQWDSVNRLVIVSGDTFVTMVEWPKETPIGGRPAH